MPGVRSQDERSSESLFCLSSSVQEKFSIELRDLIDVADERGEGCEKEGEEEGELDEEDAVLP